MSAAGPERPSAAPERGGPERGGIERPILIAACACYLAGTAVTLADVALRATVGTGVPAAIELTTLLIGLGALVSMPACYLMRGHVTAKLLSELSPNRLGPPLQRFGALVSALFAALLCAIVADNLWGKIGSPQTTPDMGLPVWVLLGVVTAALGLAALAALGALWPDSRRGGDHG